MTTSKTENLRNLEADVVIIGSGGGMAAAVAAAEGEASVIVLEKQGVLGGNTRQANGLWACDSPLHKRQNIVLDKDDYFKNAMKWAHLSVVDPRVVRAYINKTGDTIRWLEEKGVEFKLAVMDPDRLSCAHAPEGRGARLMEALVKDAEKLGVKAILHASGKKILRDTNGHVNGVLAKKDGQEFEVKAKAVIIATGGFPGNVELLKKYCPDYSDNMVAGKWPYHTGDGLLMAAEIGAAIADNVPIFHNGPTPESGAWGGVVSFSRERFNVWINKMGQRFTDEAGYGVWENGNAISRQPDGVMYTVFDDELRIKLVEKVLPAPPPDDSEDDKVQGNRPPGLTREFQAGLDKGFIKKFDSWEGMAKDIGAEPEILQATIDEYNTACEQGYDPLFIKNPEYLLPLRKAPYYAIKCLVHVGETMGGIKVNERMGVLDTQGRVIPGLYTGCVLAHGWMGQTYDSDHLGGSAMSFAINSGRIAGESAASYVKSR